MYVIYTQFAYEREKSPNVSVATLNKKGAREIAVSIGFYVITNNSRKKLIFWLM